MSFVVISLRKVLLNIILYLYFFSDENLDYGNSQKGMFVYKNTLYFFYISLTHIFDKSV